MMTDDFEGIASRLVPPVTSPVQVEQVTFQCDTTERAKMTAGTPNHVIEQNFVEFSCCHSPLVLILVRNQQYMPLYGILCYILYNIVCDIVRQDTISHVKIRYRMSEYNVGHPV
jgi:hypothetical protein